MILVCDKVGVPLKASYKTGLRICVWFSCKVEAFHVEAENITRIRLIELLVLIFLIMLLYLSFFFFRALLERHWLAQAIFKLTIAADLCARHILVCYVFAQFLSDWPFV